jgi:hypothetical protein
MVVVGSKSEYSDRICDNYDMAQFKPTADPFRDTDVIDERAPRTNQTVVALTTIAGIAFGWPLVWALMAAQLGLGLTLGRRYCIPCLLYFKLIQPRIGEGRLEDSRPPRLANQMGFVFLSAAAGSWWLGAESLGLILAVMVAGLATLAATTGFCAGCEIYKLQAHFRGISERHHDSIDPSDLVGLNGHPRTMVQFTHPMCSECHEWDERLEQGPEPRIAIDVRERPDLARKYGIAVVPTVVAVDGAGTVLERLAP